MGRLAMKRTKDFRVEVLKADKLVRHMPKGDDRKVDALADDDVATLERVAASKEPPVVARVRAGPLSGPTLERLARADDHVAVGDDKRGGRIYQFHDSTMDRLYSRLTRACKTRGEEEALRREYIALQRYKHHWHHGGLQSSVGSVDLNRVFAPDPTAMSGMAKSEKQAHHRQQWREARVKLEERFGKVDGQRYGIVVDNVVCAETSLEIAGYAIGYGSPYRARDAARKMLRQAGQLFSNFWGVG